MRLRNSLKKFLYRRVPGFAGAYPYYGVRVRYPRGSWMIDAACDSGVYEGETVALASKLVRPESVYLDVGANLGFMAIPILAACPTCRVVSFEPSPNALPYLERTARESRFASRWRVLGEAVGAAVGEAEFSVGAASAYNDGFTNPMLEARRESVLRVPVTTIDATWAGLGRPPVSLIKVDVDGPEYQVLLGAEECVRACRPAVFIECTESYLRAAGHSPGQIYRWFADRGYAALALPGLVPVRSLTEFGVHVIRHYNYLMVPGDEGSPAPAAASARGAV